MYIIKTIFIYSCDIYVSTVNIEILADKILYCFAQISNISNNSSQKY